MRRSYKVACLAGDGHGPELMAEATRALRKVARMHGFAIEDVHVPFGREALTRSGHLLPQSTRGAVLEADAVLVANDAEPTLARRQLRITNDELRIDGRLGGPARLAPPAWG